MSVKWEKQEGNEGVLTVTVDVDTVNKGLDQAFKKVVQQINVPGFRKGKMPRQMFDKRFGVESLYQDALDVILPDAYAKAVEEAGISPVSQPEIDLDQMEKGKELIFTAKVIVKPEATLGEYKGLEVEKQDTDVSDEDVQAELETLQQNQAELAVKEDAAVEGDTVVLDFEGFVDGEAFEGGQADNYSIELGSNTFIPGFEEQLVGVKAEEEKDVTVTFPEEYHAAELAGKEAVFKVKIHEVKGKELPELDDEFAKDVDEEVETLDALKAKISERLLEEKKQAAEQAIRDAVVEKAAENTQVDIPEAMIDNETGRMLQEFEQRLQAQGMTLDMYFQFSGQEEKDLKQQMAEDAKKRVLFNLTLEAVAIQENLVVTDEDVDAELEEMAKQYNLEKEQIAQALGGQLDGLKEELKIKKAVDFLVENSKTVA
ncbi:trigger factor [Bacillus fonticola]|uniref:trigger factor n=1 Tax=Bacillus fonticola TaxID=2728853 RepID=UPI001475AFBF|nr:trigger factor [Bacillus fonticola]